MIDTRNLKDLEIQRLARLCEDLSNTLVRLYTQYYRLEDRVEQITNLYGEHWQVENTFQKNNKRLRAEIQKIANDLAQLQEETQPRLANLEARVGDLTECFSKLRL